MGNELNSLGWTKTGNKVATRNQSVVVAKNGGGFYVLVPEFNASGLNSGYGDGSNTHRLKVFDCNDSLTTSTLVYNANISTWTTPADIVSADVFADGSLGILYERGDTKAICYRKLTRTGWSMGSQETVYTPPAGSTIRVADIALTDGDVPTVALLEERDSSPKLRMRVFAKATTGGAWVNGVTEDLMSGANPNSPYQSIAITSPNAGSAATRPLVVAVDQATVSDDRGSSVYTMVLAESSGAIVNLNRRRQILVGNMGVQSAFYPRRSYLFPSASGGEVTYAHIEAIDKKNIVVYRFTFDGNTYTETLVPQTHTITINPEARERFAASYANDVVNFYLVNTAEGKMVSVNYLVKIDRAAANSSISGPYTWDNREGSGADRVYPMGGTGRYSRTATRQGMVNFNRNGQDLYKAIAWANQAPPAPTEVSPNGTLVTGTPQVSLKASLGTRFPQSKHKAVWQFALDANFTNSVKTYTQSDDKFTLISNTEAVGSYVFISDTLPESLALSSGNWFVRAALIDEYGTQGPWSANSSVGLTHPPAASNLSPNTGMTIADNAVQFIWTFTDPKVGDTQTAFQVLVERNDTGATVLDTGKVTSANSTSFQNLPTGLEGVMLRWSVRLWDSDNTVGVYSEYATFQVAAPPSVTIDAPGAGSTGVSGTPAILFTPTMPSGRRTKAFVVTLSVGSTVVRTSGTVPVEVTTGQQISWRVPEPMLENNVTYTVNVSVQDEANLTATATPKSFTTGWVAPASASDVNLDINDYNTDDRGYIELSWSAANQDVNFEAWVIERKADAINQVLTVVEEGAWEEVGRVTDTSGAPKFRDFYAPSGYKVSYIVRQLVNRNGDRAISGNEPAVYSYPISEGYWMIEPYSNNGSPSAFRLANVVEESYSPEWEESEFVVAGRGRHIDRGDYLGVKGSLTAQIRDTMSSTARMKKQRLEAARDSESAVYLRNPFGDVFHVALSNLNVSRVSGVGKSEFVDVTVPYSEVFESDD